MIYGEHISTGELSYVGLLLQQDMTNLKSCLNSYIILAYFSSTFTILPLTLYVSENEPVLSVYQNR